MRCESLWSSGPSCEGIRKSKLIEQVSSTPSEKLKMYIIIFDIQTSSPLIFQKTTRKIKKTKKETSDWGSVWVSGKWNLSARSKNVISDGWDLLYPRNFTEFIDISTRCKFSEMTCSSWHLIWQNVSFIDLSAKTNVSLVMLLFQAGTLNPLHLTCSSFQRDYAHGDVRQLFFLNRLFPSNASF